MNETKGVVVALKIWDENGANGPETMAEAVYAFGTIETIKWNNVMDKAKVLPFINGYTIIFDERARRLSYRELKKRATHKL